MQINITTSVEGDSGLDRIINNLKLLDNTAVEAGLFGGFEAKKAMWQEYGTSRGIPSRPFLRNTLYENEARFANYIAPFIIDVMNGGSAEMVYSTLGPFMVMSIQRTIAAGGFAPLAPVTIARKGHSKPLIETGSMYGSIEWRVSR